LNGFPGGRKLWRASFTPPFNSIEWILLWAGSFEELWSYLSIPLNGFRGNIGGSENAQSTTFNSIEWILWVRDLLGRI